MRTFLTLMTFILLLACRQVNIKDNSLSSTAHPDSLKNLRQTTITTPDIISEPCAIVVTPTDRKIDSLKKAGPEEDFYTVADDNQFYIGTARAYLDSTKTKTYDKESTGIIKFQLPEGKIIDFNLSKLYWGVILFNGETEPIESDITNFSVDFEKYMKK